MRKILLNIIFLFLTLHVFAQDKQFSEEEVSYWNTRDSVKIGGTLTIPKVGKNFTTVLLITGSGQQDRDETLLSHKPFKAIAEYLSERGIAVLRVDDRGKGKTTGKFELATTENNMYDVLAGVEFLKTRSEVNPKKIGLIGHSEGGMIVPMAASKTKDVAFVVSLAGTAVDGLELLAKQNYAIFKSQKIDTVIIAKYIDLFFLPNCKNVIQVSENKQLIAKSNELLGEFKNSVTKEEYNKFVPAAIQDSTFSKIFIRQLNTPWFKYFLDTNPAIYWEKVKCPVLAMNGTKDLQVDAELNLNAIEKSLNAAKNKHFEIKRLENHNHLFQIAQTGSPSEYSQKTDTPTKQTLEILYEWIEKLK